MNSATQDFAFWLSHEIKKEWHAKKCHVVFLVYFVCEQIRCTNYPFVWTI
jgi:hypothetical protein